MEHLIIKMVICGGISMKNVISFYSFADDNKFAKHYSNFSEALFITFFPLIIYYIFKILLEKIFGYDIISSDLNKIFVFFFFIIGIVCIIKFKKSLKGIYLYNNYLQINTNFFLRHYLFTINPKIKYSEIKEVALRSKKSQTYDEWNEKHIYFVEGYYNKIDCYIRIETIYERKYCFSLENPYEFLEMIERITDEKCVVIDDTK